MAKLRRQTRGRIAAVVLIALFVASAVATYAGYTGAYLATDTVTVSASRAGLVMDPDAKVKYLGVRVGTVRTVQYSRDGASLDLEISHDYLRYIPANSVVRISSNTIFGAKSVEFLAPDGPSIGALRPGAHLQASAVQLEVNTLFERLVGLLHEIDPAKLNAMLSAIGQGLRDHGEDLGSVISGTNTLAGQMDSKTDVFTSDVRAAADVATIYAGGAPALGTIVDNTGPLAKTLGDQQQNLTSALLSTIAVSNSGSAVLEPAAQDLIAAITRLRAPLKVFADYSPEYGCLFKTMADGLAKFGPIFGGKKPGLFTSSNFILGVPAYTYPESLPVVNASGGPNCRGLPDLPSKQFGGSWYRAPFLVTDSANVPYEPYTEMNLRGPDTLQFLFHGAFAERDDY